MADISPITKKRLAAELKGIRDEPLDYIDTFPDEKDQLTWWFVLRGKEDSGDYKGGFYIGKIKHDKNYPINPPDFYMMTPNGRFDIEKRICLTNSSYHRDSWRAVWNISTMLVAFYSVMMEDKDTGISHIVESSAERKLKAKNSINYNMTNYKDIWLKFERFVNPDGTVKSDDEIKELSKPVEKKKKKKNVENNNEAVANTKTDITTENKDEKTAN